MPTTPLPPTTIVLAIIAILVVIAVVVALARASRSRRLRDTFGPEYGRTVASLGDRDKAEAELARRQAHRRGFTVRDLAPEARQRYREQWKMVQARFVDAPQEAIAQAEALIVGVMRDRGYPVDEFEQQAADLSVDYPTVVNNYRAAHAIAVDNESGSADTERMRQAMIHYRALFDELVGAADQQRLKETG